MLDPVPAAGLEPDEKKGGDHMSDIKGEYGLFIDYEYCSGCNACLTACKMEHDMPESDFGIRIFQDGPVQYSDGSWHYDYLPMPTDLCDLCADRVAAGKEPTCVHHCQAFCMKFGSLEDLAKELAAKPKQVLWAPCA